MSPESQTSEDWAGTVVPSPLDSRVWCAVLPDTDMMEGALHASTSLRRCKKHVEDTVRHDIGAEVVWCREGDAWQAYVKEES